MTEVVVVFVVCVCSLLLASGLSRSLWNHGKINPELERLLGAVQRACADFLWQETRQLGLLLGIVGAAFALVVELGSSDPGKLGSLGWNALGLCLGAMTGVAVAHLGSWAAARATGAALLGLPNSLDAATTATFRGAAVGALVADAGSLLLTLAVFLSHYLYATLVGQVAIEQALLDASRCLPAAALGAVCSAAVFQLGGSSFQTAAAVAGAAARGRDARIARNAEQNPALVAELVGDYVGGVASRVTDVFSALVLCNCTALFVAVLIGRANASMGNAALTLVALPLVVRAMSLLASMISMGTCRFGGPLPLPGILAASGLSHAVMALTGLFGAVLWLLGEPLYGAYLGAGAFGILAGGAATGLLFLNSRRWFTARPGASVAARPVTSVARAFGFGLQHTWPPLLLVGLSLGAACLLGSRAPIERGGLLGLVVAVAAMLGTSAFNLSECLFATIAENVLRISRLSRGRFDGAARGRARDLERMGLTVGNWGQTQGILGGASAALMAAAALPLVQSRTLLVDTSISLAHPVIILGGALGAGCLLAHIGGVLKSSSRAAGALDQDLSDRQEQNVETPGSDAVSVLPSYRVSVQLAAEAATHALLRLTLTALLTPFAIAIVLKLSYGADGGAVAAQALMAFGSIAVLTGCCAALVAQGSLVALASSRQSVANSDLADTASVRSAGEFIGRCVGPAALLGLKAIVISALATAPLLF